MDKQIIRGVAAALREARQLRKPLRPLRELFGEISVEQAYGIQIENVQFAIENKRRVVGRKIGLTSKAIQDQLGIDQPDFGTLFADMQLMSGSRTDLASLIQPRAEAEVAFIMKSSIESEVVTLSEVINSVECVTPAIEIVDSAIVNWQIGLVDTIADNASSALYVLSRERKVLDGLDLSRCTMVLKQDEEVVSTGIGAACFGNPLNALLWLARMLASLKTPICAGDVILSGALGPMVECRPGTRLEAEIADLGKVEVSFSD